MDILQNHSLRPYNTFGIAAQADWFIPFTSVEDLQLLSRDEYFQECRALTVGAGSNLLFLTNFRGIVLHSRICSLEVIQETEESVDILAGSGLVWDDFVAEMVARGYYGLENLSLIPGQVGSAAIQNIGAYGVEVGERIQAVHAVHRRTGQVRVFAHEECQYSYRHSAFKEPDHADYIITHVHLRLSKRPTLILGYADLEARVHARSSQPTPLDVREEVIAIRSAKLPDPAVIGNAGSFFMNPIISAESFAELQRQHPEVPHYPLPDGRVKVPAGWLIDRCGLKGYRMGHAGVYERQALVLVNADGAATGQDIARLAEYVQECVRTRFAIDLEPEVRYIS